jgi:hypothetical protein
MGQRWGHLGTIPVRIASRTPSSGTVETSFIIPTMAPEKQPVLKQSASPQEHFKRTVTRLARIQSHLATAPRTGKLRGKVAVITGVGSLKGIGYDFSLLTTFACPDLFLEAGCCAVICP